MHMQRDTHLRFDVSLWLAQETIRPLVQFARWRLLYPNVAILVAAHLFAYILVHIRTAGGRDEAEDKSLPCR